MKVFLVPFGSYIKGESRDDDFVAFPDNAPEVLTHKSTIVHVDQLDIVKLMAVAKETGISNPDIWMFNQEGNMKPIIVANLVKDYPDAARYIQCIMELDVDINGGDANLLNAMQINVQRWDYATPHLPNLRKRLFSRIQLDSYKKGIGFFNTKSEISKAANQLGTTTASQVKDFLIGNNMASDADSIRGILGLSKQIATYKSKNGCIAELSNLKKHNTNRTYLTPMYKVNGKVIILWEEVYTYDTHYGDIELETEVWEMLISIDLEEVR